MDELEARICESTVQKILRVLNQINSETLNDIHLRYKSIPKNIESMWREITDLRAQIVGFGLVSGNCAVLNAGDAWWFDDTVITWSSATLSDLIEKMNVYRELPRGRGRGYVIEAWVRDSKIIECIDACANDIAALLRGFVVEGGSISAR